MSWFRPLFSNRLLSPALSTFRTPKANLLKVLPSSISPLKIETQWSAPLRIGHRSFSSVSRPTPEESKFRFVAYHVFKRDPQAVLHSLKTTKPSNGEEEVELLGVLHPQAHLSEEILDAFLDVLTNSKDWKTVDTSIDLLERVAKEATLTEIMEKVLNTLTSWVLTTDFEPKINSALQKKAAAAIFKLNEHPSFKNEIDSYLAVAFLSQGDYPKSAELVEKVLKTFIETLGEKYPDVANVYSLLGSIFIKLGEFEKAINALQKALELQSANLGSEHKDLTPTMTLIGNAFYEARNYDKALKHYTHAYNQMEKTLGRGHPDFYNYPFMVALTCASKKDHALAVKYFNEALTLYNKREFEVPRSAEHTLELCNLLLLLGVAEFFNDQAAEALHHFEQALPLQKEVFGENHLDTLNTRLVIAVTHGVLKNFESASREYVEVIPLLKREIGDQKVEVAISLRNLANSLLGQKEYGSALANHREAYLIFSKTLGDEDPKTKQCREDLLNCEKLSLED